jgi:type IV secretory pathway TraG/TraD family ATPase VirD4
MSLLATPQAPKDLSYIGVTNWRDRRRIFGIAQSDRLQHLYVIGQTGTGKSTLLENLIKQDIEAGRGLAFLDPHGDSVSRLVRELPASRRPDLVYLDVPDIRSTVGFNPLEAVPVSQRALAASGIIEAFRNLWTTAWGARMEHILRNALLTLLDQPESTLDDLPRLFFEDRFREAAIRRITHPAVKAFWVREFAGYASRNKAEALSPIQNKLGAFLSQPPLYKVLTQARAGYRMRGLLDEGRIFLVNLAKGKIGGDGASLLGALIVSRLGLAGLSRADTPEDQRRPFFVYLDEFQSFTTISVASMLSELRKYRVGLNLAHQFMSQIPVEVRDAVLGNVGTMITFRLGPVDARLLVRQFGPEVGELDLANLPDHSVYVRLMVSGRISSTFSADTLPPYRPQAEGG